VEGGGQGNAPLPSPTPMAGPQAPHQLNPALQVSQLNLRVQAVIDFVSYTSLTNISDITLYYIFKATPPFADTSVKELCDIILLLPRSGNCTLVLAQTSKFCSDKTICD